MSKIRHPAPVERLSQTQERCSCAPPDPLTLVEMVASEARERSEEAIPLAPTLYARLRSTLAGHFPCAEPLSLLLLHITQFEYVQLPPGSLAIGTRIICHAPASFLEQVVASMRRVLRASDRVLVDESGSGAAVLFPQVDRVGIASISERIVHSINLLQAETVVPPLREQTEIVLGAGSYPELALSSDELVFQASRVRERVIFRPAVLAEVESPRTQRTRTRGTTRSSLAQRDQGRPERLQGIPFMQIPSRLPTRLKQLVPYALALELRCAPVGRDHNRLTVAMANPTDAQAIYRLREVTGMTIFPVSCEPSALETLLASNW
jgi:hypothetical protein